ncbi:hypothetical protein, partial [Pseudomonas sp. SWRI154]|uniref:hypothetical protein n=1 Tax=Pseudomonas sp. SWRI154 TaxID=2745501 RepID=UPI001EE29FB4
LVDTPASGAGDRKVVEVRVFFWAPIQASRFTHLEAHKNPRKRVFAFPGLTPPPDNLPDKPDSPLIVKTHMRNNIVYHCYKFLLHDSEEPRE